MVLLFGFGVINFNSNPNPKQNEDYTARANECGNNALAPWLGFPCA